MTVALALSAAANVVACGGGEAAACAPPERTRAQFPAGHVLPGQPEPSYVSEPPTSGPHIPVASIPSEVSEPLGRPLQVGLLELGLVLVQYRPADVSADEVDRLGTLAGDEAGDEVVVAPNPALDDPVVASAWLTLQRCDAVDVDALARFADEYGGAGPGGHLED